MSKKKECKGNASLVVDKEIIIMAFRYALGRMTFAPDIVIENIKENLSCLNVNDLELIKREILDTKHLGIQCDIDTWNAFIEYLDEQLHQLRG